MYFIRALQYYVVPNGTAHCCAMNTSALFPTALSSPCLCCLVRVMTPALRES